MQIVNCTSDWVINNSNNEEIIFNQRKWLEILVDFILNLREGDKKSLDESEYVKIFNYHQFYSIEIMKFFFEVFKNSSIELFFIVFIEPNCKGLKISKFLINYIEKQINDAINLLDKTDANGSFTVLSIALYIKNLIESNDFSIDRNTQINNSIEKLFQKYLTLTSRNNDQIDLEIVENYLDAITKTLSYLYNEESIYYDDENLLEKILDNLKEKCKEQKDDLQQENVSKERNVYLMNYVLISLIAYKSNIIDNSTIQGIYEMLNKVKYIFFVIFGF